MGQNGKGEARQDEAKIIGSSSPPTLAVDDERRVRNLDKAPIALSGGSEGWLRIEVLTDALAGVSGVGVLSKKKAGELIRLSCVADSDGLYPIGGALIALREHMLGLQGSKGLADDLTIAKTGELESRQEVNQSVKKMTDAKLLMVTAQTVKIEDVFDFVEGVAVATSAAVKALVGDMVTIVGGKIDQRGKDDLHRAGAMALENLKKKMETGKMIPKTMRIANSYPGKGRGVIRRRR